MAAAAAFGGGGGGGGGGDRGGFGGGGGGYGGGGGGGFRGGGGGGGGFRGGGGGGGGGMPPQVVGEGKGIVKFFNPQKGFGFIVRDDGGEDVFVHISAVEQAGLTDLADGQPLEFTLVDRGGRISATNLRIEGEPMAVERAERGPQRQLTGEKAQGTVKFFNSMKGFGFIQRDDGQPDAFVHISAVERAGNPDAQRGRPARVRARGRPPRQDRCGEPAGDQLRAVPFGGEGAGGRVRRPFLFLHRACVEAGEIGLELMRRDRVDVHHVARRIISVADVRLELRLQRHVPELIFRAMERRREIVIAVHRQDLHARILPDGVGEIGAGVGDLLLAVRRLVREFQLVRRRIPRVIVRPVGERRFVAEVAEQIIVERADERAGNGASLRIVIGAFARRCRVRSRRSVNRFGR